MASRVLIVDDDVHIRKLLKLSLRGSGLEVREAATGEEAMEIAAAERFDLVLLDLILPYYGGFRLCQRFKGGGESKPHVIVMTADDSPETRATAKECGADDFLPKPFSPKDVAERVARALRAPV